MAAKKMSAAAAFRQIVARKTQPSDETFIKEVRRMSGSTTFDVKHLAWYRSMHNKGKLSPGRKAVAA